MDNMGKPSGMPYDDGMKKDGATDEDGTPKKPMTGGMGDDDDTDGDDTPTPPMGGTGEAPKGDGEGDDDAM